MILVNRFKLNDLLCLFLYDYGWESTEDEDERLNELVHQVGDLLDRFLNQLGQDEELWLIDEVQFPRLLSEILATVEITNEDWAALRDSMDLEDHELQELFDRAVTAWERIKKEVLS